jgi:hypothetical protein
MRLGLAHSLASSTLMGAASGPAPVLTLPFANTRSLTAVVGPTPSFSRSSSATYRDIDNSIQVVENGVPRFHYDESLAGSTATVTSAMFSGTLPFYSYADFADIGFGVPTYLLSGQYLLYLNAGVWEIQNIQTSAIANAYTVAITLKSLGLLIEPAATNLFINSSTTRFVGYSFSVSNSSGSTKGYVLSFDCGSISGPCEITDDELAESVGGSTLKRTYYKFNLATGFSYGFTVSIGSIKNIQIEEVTDSDPYYSFGTSYIPTTSSPVTRAADVCSITSTNFSNFYNASAGTFIVQYTTSQNTGAYYVSLSNGDINQNSISFRHNATNLTSDVIYRSANNEVANFTNIGSGISDDGSPRKIATSYSANNFSACSNGGTVLTDSTGAVPTGINQMYIGYDGTSDRVYYSSRSIASIKYYNVKLSDAEIQSLSQL